MPRFFFDVHDGQDFNDDIGQLLPDLKAARRHARRYAGSLITELDDAFWGEGDWRIDVRDEGGAVVLALALANDAAPPLAVVRH